MPLWLGLEFCFRIVLVSAKWNSAHGGGGVEATARLILLVVHCIWHFSICTEWDLFKFSRTLELRDARSGTCSVVKHCMKKQCCIALTLGGGGVCVYDHQKASTCFWCSVSSGWLHTVLRFQARFLKFKTVKIGKHLLTAGVIKHCN